MLRRFRSLVVVVCVVIGPVDLVACSSNHDTAADSARVTVAKNPNSGLSAIVMVETQQPERVSLVAMSTKPDRHVVTTPTTTDLTTRHTIPLLGMRADRHYDVQVSLTSRSGRVQQVAGSSFDTSPLPATMPRFDVHSVPTRVSPGVVLFNLTYWPPADSTLKPPVAADYAHPTERPDAGWIVGVDEQGKVVWYYSSILSFTDVTPTNHGTLIVDAQDSVIREIDMLGNTLHEWGSGLTKDPGVDLQGKRLASKSTQLVDIESAHHDAHELPNGDLITLSTELIQLPADVGAKLCPQNPARNIVADVVAEFDRSGKVVHTWRLSKMLDVETHPGTELCQEAAAIAPPAWFYPNAESVRDWTHANAVLVDQKSNTLIVSMRHLDAVMGFRYVADDNGPAGALLWELGPHGDMKLEGVGQWQYHQHAPELHADGTMFLYDNGNLRPGTGTAPGDQPEYSRAVEYKIDFAHNTVRQIWQHRDVNPWGTPTFAPFLGDADLTPGGTVLITHGGRSDNKGRLAGRVVEVVPGTNGAADQIVFDITPRHRDGEGWTMYRAEKMPTLYIGAVP